jgi:hypothetical protein
MSGTVSVSASNRPTVAISQQSVIFAALFIGFLVYLLLKGRLAAYVGLLFKSQAKPASTVASSQSNNQQKTGTGNPLGGGQSALGNALNGGPAGTGSDSLAPSQTFGSSAGETNFIDNGSFGGGGSEASIGSALGSGLNDLSVDFGNGDVLSGNSADFQGAADLAGAGIE